MEEKTIGNPRYTDKEKEVIKNTFAENQELLGAIQKVFLQLPLNSVELSILSMNVKGDVLKIIRKTILPQLDDDVPTFNVYDLWMTQDIKGKMAEDVVIGIKSTKVVIDYLDQQLKVLESSDYNKKQKKLYEDLLNIEKKADSDIYIDVMARTSIMVIVQRGLASLLTEAGKKETPAQREKRLKQDSSK